MPILLTLTQQIMCEAHFFWATQLNHAPQKSQKECIQRTYRLYWLG